MLRRSVSSMRKKLLRYVPDERLPGAQPRPYVAAVHRDAAARRVQETEQEISQRTLARTGSTDDAHRFAASDRQVHLPDGVLSARLIHVGHSVEHDRIGECDGAVDGRAAAWVRLEYGGDEVVVQMGDEGMPGSRAAQVERNPVGGRDQSEGRIGEQTQQRHNVGARSKS